MRECPRCKSTGDELFSPGAKTWCKRCHSEAVARVRLKRMGITLEDYARMANDQNRQCAICHADQSLFNRSLHADHNPKTGKFRALLCGKCNQLLGWAADDVAKLQACIEYIRKHE